MDIFLTIVLYVLWIIFILGLLVTTFTDFQYTDLNVLVIVALFFAAVNTFFKLNKRV